MFSLFVSANAAENKVKLNFPPSVKLSYQIRADIKGILIDGTGSIDWNKVSDKYNLSSETRTALTGILVAEKSEGLIDQAGLAPENFSIKRFRKELISTRIDRKARQIIYQDNANPQSLQGGEQDRLSVLWQLLTLARTSPSRLALGSKHKFIVIGTHDSEPWIFEIRKSQRIHTVMGEIDAIPVSRLTSETPEAQGMEIWLAPSLDWLPVQMRLSEKNGDFVEQSLEKIEKK